LTTKHPSFVVTDPDPSRKQSSLLSSSQARHVDVDVGGIGIDSVEHGVGDRKKFEWEGAGDPAMNVSENSLPSRHIHSSPGVPTQSEPLPHEMHASEIHTHSYDVPDELAHDVLNSKLPSENVDLIP
jgi:hypothetical protein